MRSMISKDLVRQLAESLQERSIGYHKRRIVGTKQPPRDLRDHRDPWRLCPADPCLRDRELLALIGLTNLLEKS